MNATPLRSMERCLARLAETAPTRDLLAELGEEAGPPSNPDPSDEPL